VVKIDGSINKEKLPFFDGLNNAVATGISAGPSKAIFGERPVTKMLKASIENWTNITNLVDEIVVK